MFEQCVNELTSKQKKTTT